MTDPSADFAKRDQYILGSVRFCEICNRILREDTKEYADHYGPLKHHQPKWLLIVRCAQCGETVLDTSVSYSIERNQFWCKKCIEREGYGIFRSERPLATRTQVGVFSSFFR
jgi:hypothetical protein